MNPLIPATHFEKTFRLADLDQGEKEVALIFQTIRDLHLGPDDDPDAEILFKFSVLLMGDTEEVSRG